MNIRIKVVVNKKKAIEMLHSRYDQQMIKISESKNDAAHRAVINESLADQITIDPLNEIYIESEKFTQKVTEFDNHVVSLVNNIEEKENILFGINQELDAEKQKTLRL